jgi:hypothetical protein
LAEIEENKQQKIAAAAANTTKQQQKNVKGMKQQKGDAENMDKGGKVQPNPTEPERPIEQFYNKLKTILAINGKEKEQQQIIGDRQRWPKKLVKQVLAELIGETPRDILAKLVL